MIKSEFCKRIIVGIMLAAFCAATIVFQNINLKNYYSVKAQQEASVDQSFNGQLGLLEEENSTSSNTTTLEEEDDEFKIESILFSAQHHELLTLQFLVIQEHLFSEHHPEIVSPPPQA
jgi:hypothetical protein